MFLKVSRRLRRCRAGALSSQRSVCTHEARTAQRQLSVGETESPYVHRTSTLARMHQCEGPSCTFMSADFPQCAVCQEGMVGPGGDSYDEVREDSSCVGRDRRERPGQVPAGVTDMCQAGSCIAGTAADSETVLATTGTAYRRCHRLFRTDDDHPNHAHTRTNRLRQKKTNQLRVSAQLSQQF